MSWRLASSLVTLRNQVNGKWPNRNKASDGTIGDPSHAASASDHNPNAHGVVCAFDITHHPGYLDAHALANRLIANRHPNLKYIISNRRIAGSHNGWVWRAYSGSNPHSSHIHVSVGVGPDGSSRAGTYDNTTKWDIIGGTMERVTSGDIKNLWPKFFGHAADQAAINAWSGKSFKQLVYGIAESPVLKKRLSRTIDKQDVLNYLNKNLK